MIPPSASDIDPFHVGRGRQLRFSTVLLDLRIILRTVMVVVGLRGR